MILTDTSLLDLDPLQLEYRMIGPPPETAPTIVMLHEGLGCVGMWGSFPEALAAATGAGVFVYSRAGYGRSRPGPMPRSTAFLQEEACEVLPRLLDRIGFQNGVLLGHSDGASIAAIHAGSVRDRRVRGIVLIAPHFFTESIGLDEIARAREAFVSGILRDKLKRWHVDPDCAFYSWNGPWLDPDFRHWNITATLRDIDVPVLVMQGADDQYGTLAQVEAVSRQCRGPVETAILPGVRHFPYREAPEPTLKTVADFIRRHLPELP